MIEEGLIRELMDTVRVKSSVGEAEVQALAEACIRDMDMSGVYVTDPTEPGARQAIKLYVKGSYGYDENNEKYMEMYRALKDAMALSGDYPKEVQDG